MSKKILKIIRCPKLILYKLDKMNLLRLSDKSYLKLRFFAEMGYKINIDNPKTFNEKIQWLKLYDRNPKYCMMVDKYAVREYISETIGEEYLVPLIGVYDSFDKVDFDSLPNQFVIKCNHDSGGLLICKDKKKFDKVNAKKKISASLNRNYYYSGREWPYKNITPKIIVEKYLKNGKYSDLTDYKVMCFNGIPKIVFTCTNRFSNDGLKFTFFDLNWKKLPVERKYASSDNMVAKPNNFEEMIKLSSILSKSMPFVRIDWYEVNGKLYFGEITFYPASGFKEFSPFEWDYKLGDMIKLPIKRG